MLILKLLLSIVVCVVFLVVSPVYAASKIIQGGVIVNPTRTYKVCDNPSFCTNLGDCWNDASPGSSVCGTKIGCAIDGSPFGVSWSRYKYDYCAEFSYNDLTDTADCRPVYNKSAAVYSTADKCSNGANIPNPPEAYLRSGSCDGRIGGIYKTCCSNTSPSYVIDDPRSSMGGNSTCVAVTPSSGAPTPPMDGVCPLGSKWIMCGVSQARCDLVNTQYPGQCTTAPCGQSACGPTNPALVCNGDKIQNNGETGVDCGGGGCSACLDPDAAPGATISFFEGSR